MNLPEQFDLAIVGAGIVGLAHALAAARNGCRVVVIDRDARANGASVRNFGFITVTGQERGTVWGRAMRSRDVWAEIAGPAGIDVVHRGTTVVARRPEARAVVEAFLATEMGEGCRILERSELRDHQPELRADGIECALWSPHELRVESRDAIPRLARHLAESFGDEFRRETAVRAIAPPYVETSRGTIRAAKVVVCPGDDLATLFPERVAAYGVTRCKLHMMRLADPGFRLQGSVMSDLGLARYAGYAALPAVQALKRRLEVEQADALDNGVHLIVVQSADGSLVVGDSHQYGATPDPFAAENVDAVILDEFKAVFGCPVPPTLERWTGTYASAPDRTMFVDTPHPDVRLVMVTSGTGASTGFAIGEEVVADLLAVDTLQRRAAS